MSVKEELYERYRSTHIRDRKGEASLATFARSAPAYSKKYGEFLPRDKNAALVDIGCGDGRFVWWLQSLGYTRAEGCDISAEQIQTARGLGVQGVEQADLFDYFKNSTKRFDVIFLRDVLEHFPKDEVVRIMRAAFENLREGGRVVLHVPNGASPFHGRILYGDFTHELAFNVGNLSQIFSLVGFANHAFKPDEFPVLRLAALVRYCGWKIAEMAMKAVLFCEVGRGALPHIVTQNLIASAEKPAGISGSGNLRP